VRTPQPRPTCSRRRAVFAALACGAASVLPVVDSFPAQAAAGHDDTVYTRGGADFFGSPATDPFPGLVAIAGLPRGDGYWMVSADGRVLHYGEARWYGSMYRKRLRSPIAGIVATPTGRGYWLFTHSGSVYHFGDATFRGSAAGDPGASAIMAMASTPSGNGYWLLNADGRVFNYGDAGWYGTIRGEQHSGFVIGIAPTISGRGYWLATTSGGVFSYGDADFHGSLGASPPARIIVGIARTPTGGGYWLATEGGRAVAFGDAEWKGDARPIAIDRRVVDFAVPTMGGQGYWFLVQPQPPNFTLVGPGSSGPLVVKLQQRLLALGYWVTVDGDYGPITEQAVFAFQKYEGLPRTGTMTVATNRRLSEARRPVPRSTSGDVIELDVARQVILIARDGRARWVFNTSTGTEGSYVFEGQTYIAHTPRGHFSIYRQIDGLRIGRLGSLWRPKYWSGGVAFHGSRSIPPYPASHGCSRLSYPAIDFVWANNLMPLGAHVWSY